MRVIFMGTAEFAVPSLYKLILAGHDVTLVVTQPDRPAGRGKKMQSTPVKILAAEYGLEVIQPESIRTPEFTKYMASLAPEIIVVVAYGRILPEDLLKLPVHGCINVHGSLLPAYRGSAPVQRSIMAGEKTVGVTTMYLDKSMDTGDIILQKAITLADDNDSGETMRILADEGADLLLDTLDQIEWGIASRVVQNHEMATYAPPLTREDELIKWDSTATSIMNQIRGLAPAPGAYTRWNDMKLKIFKAQVVATDKAGSPGEVVEAIPGQGFVVQTGQGGLLILEVQREGKNKIGGGDFLKGSNLAPGSILG